MQKDNEDLTQNTKCVPPQRGSKQIVFFLDPYLLSLIIPHEQNVEITRRQQ